VRGIVRIDSFDAYPLKFHQNEKTVREAVMKRGNKCALKWGDKFLRHSVGSLSLFAYLYLELMHPQFKSRTTFRQLNPNYVFPTPVPPKAEKNPDPVPVINHR